MFELLLSLYQRARCIFYAIFYRLIGQPAFARRGKRNKIYGWKSIIVGKSVKIGDYCWIEAVQQYGGEKYNPKIIIGDNVAISDFTHISAVSCIELGSGCLLGSKIYIGDHTHGDHNNPIEHTVPPGKRPLSRISDIYIGDNTWICDGVIVLPSTNIKAGSVIGANSVVKLVTTRPALIAGNPAKIIKYFD